MMMLVVEVIVYVCVKHALVLPWLYRICVYIEQAHTYVYVHLNA